MQKTAKKSRVKVRNKLIKWFEYLYCGNKEFMTRYHWFALITCCF